MCSHSLFLFILSVSLNGSVCVCGFSKSIECVIINSFYLKIHYITMWTFTVLSIDIHNSVSSVFVMCVFYVCIHFGSDSFFWWVQHLMENTYNIWNIEFMYFIHNDFIVIFFFPSVNIESVSFSLSLSLCICIVYIYLCVYVCECFYVLCVIKFRNWLSHTCSFTPAHSIECINLLLNVNGNI